MSFFQIKKGKVGDRGFTIIELIVTVSIFAFMTAFLVAKYGAFNQSVLLSNMAYDTALTLRNAQTYGVSVKSDPTTSSFYSGNYTGAFGVHFDTNSSNDINKSFYLFVDTNKNGAYDPGQTGDTIVSKYTLKRGFYISQICTDNGLGADGNLQCNSNSIDILFKRPDPAAIINAKCNGLPCESATVYAEINISASDGGVEGVTINKIGQISVRKKETTTSTTSTSPNLSASLYYSPSEVSYGGGNVTLTWSSAGALYCSGDKFNTNNAVSGSVQVYQGAATTYTLKCYGSSGASSALATDTKTVPMSPPPSAFLAFTPNQVTPYSGGNVRLTWSSTGTSYCTGDKFNTSNATSNSTGVEVYQTTATQYILKCYNGSGVVVASDQKLVPMAPSDSQTMSFSCARDHDDPYLVYVTPTIPGTVEYNKVEWGNGGSVGGDVTAGGGNLNGQTVQNIYSPTNFNSMVISLSARYILNGQVVTPTPVTRNASTCPNL